jgi:hypothetical protein
MTTILGIGFACFVGFTVIYRFGATDGQARYSPHPSQLR